MKKVLLIAGLMMCYLLSMASGSMTINSKSGESVKFEFDSQPEVSFLGDKLLVKTADAGTPVEFEMDDIDSISMSDSSGVSETEASTILMRATSMGVMFSNLPADSEIYVYSINGGVVKHLRSNDTQFELRRDELAKGVYIVKINNFTSKITL